MTKDNTDMQDNTTGINAEFCTTALTRKHNLRIFTLCLLLPCNVYCRRECVCCPNDIVASINKDNADMQDNKTEVTKGPV